MKLVQTNKPISIHTRIRAVECYVEPFFFIDEGLGNFKTATRETGGNRNVVSEENAVNATSLMECKEIK